MKAKRRRHDSAFKARVAIEAILEALSEPRAEPCGVAKKDSPGKLAEGVYAAVEKNLACFINSFYYFFPHENHRYLEKHDYHTNGNCKEIWRKAGFSFDWFDTGRPDEIAIRVIPDRKELSRRLKGAGKSYSPLRDSVHELLQERSEEMA